MWGKYESKRSGLIELVVERGHDLLNMQSVHSKGPSLAPRKDSKSERSEWRKDLLYRHYNWAVNAYP